MIDTARTAVDAGTQCIIFDMSNVPSLGLTSMVALHSIAILLKGEAPVNLEHDGYAVMRAVARDLKTGGKQHNFKLLNPQPQVKAQLNQSGFTDYLDVCTELAVDIEVNYLQPKSGDKKLCFRTPLRRNLLALHCYRNCPATGMVMMLTQVNSLPGAGVESPVGDRQGNGTPQQQRFDVSRHIVRPFIIVPIVGGIFRHHFVKMALKIDLYGSICVFVKS